MFRLSSLILSAHLCQTVVSANSLGAAARVAHNEIPELQRRERERRVLLEKKLLEKSISRELEDAENYYEESQYVASQYNVYQYNEYDQQWDPYMEETEFGFDITNYSFKYTGCHDIGRTIDSDGSPSRYATFRLCPTDTCSGGSTFGCKSDYGEYIVPVDQLVSSLIEHNEARVLGYCQYCQHCAAIESYSEFSTEVLLHKEYVLGYAQQKFSRWCAQNGYSSISSNDDAIYQTAAQALWKEMRNGNYASNYVSQSRGSQSYSAYNYGQTNSRQSWNFNGDYSGSSQYTDEQKSWQTMGAAFGRWYDRTIYPGYYDSYGNFVSCWGYKSANSGFICLDIEDAVYWDKDLFGNKPDTWADFIVDGFITYVYQEEFCDSRYSSSCYNQYDACMELLNDQEENTYNDRYGDYNDRYANTNDRAQALDLTDLLKCTMITEDDMDYNALSFYDQYVYTQEWNRNRDRRYADDYGYAYNVETGEAEQNYYGEDGEDFLYVGPACGGDGMSIKLAVYGDEYCTKGVDGITVKELLGYNPLADNMDIFPNDCISCQPPVGEVVWYETEDIQDPVLPFCSMLYQLSGKCNAELNPSGRYNPQSLYTYEDNGNFLNDVCTIVKGMNEETTDRQSWLKKWSDDMRMMRNAMSPGAKAGFVFGTLFLAGLTVVACIYGNMQDLGPRTNNKMRPDDIPAIPDFDYQKAEKLERKDSGVQRARTGHRRRPPPSPAARVSRSRTLDF